MHVTVLENAPTHVRVALSGRLDTRGAGAAELPFTAAIAPRRVHAVVDLSGVEFISSMGIRMLVSVARSLRTADARMVLHSAPDLVAEAIDHAMIEELVLLVDDEASAIDSIST